MFNRIGSIIEFIFVAAFAAAVGLVGYYYCWLSPWNMATKITAIVGFGLWGLIDMLFCVMFGLYMWDETQDLDRENVWAAIGGMIFALVVPGLLYLIGLIVTQANKSRLRRRYGVGIGSGGSGGNYTPPKKRLEEYESDEQDPVVIDKRTKPEEKKKPKHIHVKPGVPERKKAEKPAKKQLIK